MKWYKMYRNSMQDIKFKKLSKKSYPFVYYWTAWCIILDASSEKGGRFTYDDREEREIIFELIDNDEADLNRLIEDIESVGLIDWSESDDYEGEIIVKNWDKYQSSQFHSTERVQKHRADKLEEEKITNIIREVNVITGKKYNENTESTRSSIRARLSDGHSPEDLLAVVKWKQKDWGNRPDMQKFVRPSTLFRPGNFDNYLNEIPKDTLKAMVDGTLIKVRDMNGTIRNVTQEQFDQAEKGFYNIIG